MSVLLEPPIVPIPAGESSSGWVIDDYSLPVWAGGEKAQLAFPNWMTVSSGTILEGVLSTLADTLSLIESDFIKSRDTVSNYGTYSQPRLVWAGNPPSDLIRDSYLQSTQLFYRFSSGSPWLEAFSLQDLWHLYTSDGPCFYLTPTFIVGRNFNRTLYSSTGTLTSEGWRHTIPSGAILDGTILTCSDKRLPARRWTYHEPEDRFRASGSLIAETEITYISLPLQLLASGSVDILVVQGASSGLSKLYPTDLNNSWDCRSLKAGIARRAGEDNLSLKKRTDSVFAFGFSDNKNISLLSIARTLGILDILYWDGKSTLSLGVGASGVLVAGFPSTGWALEELVPQELPSLTGSIRRYTSSKNTLLNHQLFINGRPSQASSITNGIFEIPAPKESSQADTLTVPRVEAILVYENWRFSSSGLININLPTLEEPLYMVAVLKNIKGNSLSNLRETLFEDGKLSAYGIALLILFQKKYPYTYDKCKWGIHRFYENESGAPSPIRTPLSFED